jgi:hypothetical protein
MKAKTPLVYILAILTALPLVGTVAPAATLTIIQTFDFPPSIEAINATLPQKISDQLDLTGTVIYLTGRTRAFVYKIRIEKFSPPLHDPNDTGLVTRGRGINNLRHIVGEYLNGADGTYHGYKMFHPDFVELDVPGAIETMPLGTNNAGDVVGTCVFSDGTQPAFISVHQDFTIFAVLDAAATFASQLNTANEVIGYYVDANNTAHGYTRDSLGNLTYPIDMPGATQTALFGNNDSNWGVGRYTDESGVIHGLYYITPDDMQTFDYPGSSFTSINGINVDGFVCGYYVDEIGIAHGFVGKVDENGVSEPSTNLPMVPVAPAYRLPEIPGMVTPAL